VSTAALGYQVKNYLNLFLLAELTWKWNGNPVHFYTCIIQFYFDRTTSVRIFYTWSCGKNWFL